MEGISTGGQSFLQSLEDMVRRIERLERVVTLLAASVLPYKPLLSREAFVKYLAPLCSDDQYDKQKPWRCNYSQAFTHKDTFTQIDFSQLSYGEGSEDQLMDHLITIASLEGRMPARVLADIQPDVFPSAVDALATVADTDAS